MPFANRTAHPPVTIDVAIDEKLYRVTFFNNQPLSVQLYKGRGLFVHVDDVSSPVSLTVIKQARSQL